jgi:quinol monooxygenase YgiN
MTSPAIIAKITAQPGKRAELVAALQAMVDATNDEPGTIQYLLHTDDGDADVVWFYERYTDAAAVDAHRSSEAMKTVGLAVRDLAAGRPELTMLTLVSGKGV